MNSRIGKIYIGDSNFNGVKLGNSHIKRNYESIDLPGSCTILNIECSSNKNILNLTNQQGYQIESIKIKDSSYNLVDNTVKSSYSLDNGKYYVYIKGEFSVKDSTCKFNRISLQNNLTNGYQMFKNCDIAEANLEHEISIPNSMINIESIFENSNINNTATINFSFIENCKAAYKNCVHLKKIQQNYIDVFYNEKILAPNLEVINYSACFYNCKNIRCGNLNEMIDENINMIVKPRIFLYDYIPLEWGGKGIPYCTTFNINDTSLLRSKSVSKASLNKCLNIANIYQNSITAISINGEPMQLPSGVNYTEITQYSIDKDDNEIVIKGEFSLNGTNLQINNIKLSPLLLTTEYMFVNCSEQIIFNIDNSFKNIKNMDYMFLNCASFNEYFEIPNSVESIKGLFSGCTIFDQSIEIPDHITNITDLFNGCDLSTSTIKLNILKNNDIITTNAFSNSNMNSIEIFGSISNNSILSLANEFVVPTCLDISNLKHEDIIDILDYTELLLMLYKDNNDISHDLFWGQDLEYNYYIVNVNDNNDDKVLKMMGQECFFDYENRDEYVYITDWGDGTINNDRSHEYKSNGVYLVKTQMFVYVSDGCGFIPERNDLITKVVNISNQFDSLMYSFAGCSKLEYVAKIPQNVYDMSYTFTECKSLDQPIIIPEHVESLHQTFGYCLKLNKKIEIPCNVYDMNSTFSYCQSLSEVIEIPSDVTSYGMFNGCFNLNTIILNSMIDTYAINYSAITTLILKGEIPVQDILDFIGNGLTNNTTFDITNLYDTYKIDLIEDLEINQLLKEENHKLLYIDDYSYNYYIANINSIDDSTVNLYETIPGESLQYMTDWGDGTIDNLLTHTYLQEKSYLIKTKLQSGHESIENKTITKCKNIRNDITNLSYFFANNSSLIEVPEINNVVNISNMFMNCSQLEQTIKLNLVQNNEYNFNNFVDGSSINHIILNENINVTLMELLISELVNPTTIEIFDATDSIVSLIISNENITNIINENNHKLLYIDDKSYNYYVIDTNLGTRLQLYKHSEDSSNDCYTDWGDGTANTIGDYCHDYSQRGRYIIKTKLITWGANSYNDNYNVIECKHIRNDIESMESYFKNNVALVKVCPIPDNVTNMSYCFCNCKSLNQDIMIGNNVENLSYAFSGCNNFNSFVYMGDKVENMDYMFDQCTLLNKSIVIGNNVTSMSGVFKYCKRLNQPIIIGDNVEDMSNAFYGCQNFNQPIIIGDNVEDMSNAFYGCQNFNQPIIIGDNVEDMSNAFYGCQNFNQPITIPNSVKNISYMLYCNPVFDNTVIIGDNVENMEQAFRGCSNFNQQIVIPNGVIEADYALCDCELFNNPITIPSSLTSVKYLLSNCTKFNSLVTIENGVKEIQYLFDGCNKYNKPIIIPESVTNIDGLFRDCNNFNQQIVISNNITSIDSLFCGCENFNSNVVIGNGITNMSYTFCNCLKFNLPINIPDGVTDMSYTFSGASSFNQPVIIPDSVIDVSCCFSYMDNFNSIVIMGKNIENVDSMFRSSKKFNKPVSFKNIQKNIELREVFRDCKSFNSPVEFGENVVETYKLFENCSSFNQQITIPSSLTNLNRLFYNCTNYNQPITIPDTVTTIYELFYGCSNFNQPVIIPNSVTTLYRLFYNCTNFNQPVIFSNSVSNLSYTFYNCTNFNQQVVIPENVTNTSYMFYNCTSLELFNQINWNTENITYMNSMFYGCSNLSGSILLNPKSNSIYHSNAFTNCSTNDGTQLVVNYRLDARSLVDSIIKTKSANSNVIKGIATDQYGNALVHYNIVIDDANITVNENIAYGSEKIILSHINNQYAVTSFYLDGVLIEGCTFTMPTKDVVITNVTFVEAKIIESEHDPYPNNMMTKNADGTEGKIYGEVTFEGAISLQVELTYQTESTSYDWIYLYGGSAANTTPYNDKKYGGSSNTVNLTIPGNYLRILFRTDSSSNKYYGFKARIAPIN